MTATGCSITSAAAVSTAGATGCLIRRATFFTDAGLGLALAIVRFAAADFATLRGLPRLAEFPLRSFARFGSFDPFLRLAMINPLRLVPIQATYTALLVKEQTAKSRQLIHRAALFTYIMFAKER